MNSKSNINNPSPGNIQFFFNGRRLSGRAGEPVAKALFNNGIRTLSFSIKYRRPRGISCSRGRCGMCHVEIDGVPGVPSCTTPLREGMRITREDFKPFYGPAAAAAANLIPLPAGFYYRTLTRPRFINKLFLRFLRSMAGAGRLQNGTDPPHPSFAPAVKARLKDSYGVIIVGAGISGMAAAQAASLEGTDVLIVDEYPQPGGHSCGHQNDERLAQQRDQLASKLMSETSITFSPETAACGFYPPNTLLLNMGGYLKRVSSRAFIFAAGCSDCIPLFENNDMPGIFGARAVRVLLERHDLVPGKRAVLYGTGEDLENLANLLDYRGIKTVLSASPSEGEWKARESAGTVMRPARLTAARGGPWVKYAVMTSKNERPRRVERACDLICAAFRGQPSYELPYQAGFSFELSGGAVEENRVMIPTSTERENDQGVAFHLTGELGGVLKWESKIAHGTAAGKKAAAWAASRM